MSALAGVVCLGALALIGLLPRVFFRRGRLNARWWLTAAPFGVAGLALVAGLAGRLAPMLDASVTEALALPAIVAAFGGIGLIRWTLATHARPVSLWHQEDDRPEELVMRGAYAHVRHPFYASFLLVLLGCALALPHVLTVGALAAGFLLLDRTAAREERRLSAAFGAAYASYMRRTGRFLPIRMLAMGAVMLALAASPAAGAQIGTPIGGPKIANPDFGVEQSLGNDVAVGTSMGLLAGGLVGGALCMWDEFTTVGFTSGDDDEGEDYQCDVEAPLIALLTGGAAGALVGLIVGAFGGDMPRGNFFEWSSVDPTYMPADPKQSKIDDASFIP